MKIDKRKISSSIIVIVALMLGTLFASYLYINYIKANFNSRVEDSMDYETDTILVNFNDVINSTFDDLEYFSKLINSQGEFDAAEGIEYIKLVAVGGKYTTLGVSDISGNAYMLDGSRKDISKQEFFLKSLQGENAVSNTVVEDNLTVNTYSIPITSGDEVIGVIFVVAQTDDIEKSLNNISGKIDEKIWIVSRDGMINFHSYGELSKDAEESIFTLFKMQDGENSKQMSVFKQQMADFKAGFLSFDYENDKKLMHYKPTGINEWYIITMMSEKEIFSEKDELMFRTKILISGFVSIYAVTLIIIFVLHSKNKRKIERIAYVDELTGGISFTKFKSDVERILKNNSDKYVLVDLDVDKFKYINDIFGYEEGNNVIKFIWSAVENILEANEVFAHYRADQFILLLKSNDMDHVIKRMELLALTASKRESKNEKNYEIILSMGIYPIEKKFFQIDTAIDRAALTKKSIKGKHSKIYAIYDEKLRQRVLRDQEVENMMERAISNEEFKVYYQPKYNSSTCELAGAEALVRWYSEANGMIFPNEFIPIFESNGFIVELDKYMFEHVCMDIRKWIDEGRRVVPVSVNLSQLQLYNLRFIDEYKEILDKYNIPSEYVQLELTETTLFSEADILNDIIDELHAIGFTILMDDFGTGYSSLNMLKNVPVDILKLDKSFVDDIGDQKGDIVVSTIVSLGQLLNMKIVAEGVETKEQYEFLRDIFCDEIQGYYFSRPISSEEYSEKMVKGAM